MSGRCQQPGGKTWSNLIVGRWAEDAACQGCHPDVFYPPEVHGRRARNVAAGDSELAKAICGTCPVQADCLDFALQHAEPWGVWGGLTASERTRLRSGPPPIPEMDHGSEAGAKAHRRRGEQPCKRCRDGAALASRLRHAKLREARHG